MGLAHQRRRKYLSGATAWHVPCVLYDHAELVRGKRVLELGCGTGIVGITAACLGADTLLTDIATVTQHAQCNVDANAVRIHNGQGSASCCALEWEATQESCVLLENYNVVLGADLIYASKDIAPLSQVLQTVTQHSSQASIIIAHKDRNSNITQALIAELLSKNISLQPLHMAGVITVYKASST